MWVCGKELKAEGLGYSPHTELGTPVGPLLHFTGPGNHPHLYPPSLMENEVGLFSGELKLKSY